jgi:hypothetical protein
MSDKYEWEKDDIEMLGRDSVSQGDPGHLEYPRPTHDQVTGEPIAWDRAETDHCERGTPGCSIHHTGRIETDCQTW